MALQTIEFELEAVVQYDEFPVGWTHSGVVGSGDMEVLFEQKDNGGKVTCKIVTPVVGFDDIWKKVVSKFVLSSKLGNVNIEINDNNATPFIVGMRLKQALIEAKEAGK